MRQLEFPENIQAIVGGKEYSLDNAVLKIWPESEETKGALCVEMEGVGLFTIANYRKCGQQVYMLFLMCIQRMIGNLDGKAMILKELLVLLLI